MTARVYPLPSPAGDDPRFTLGLVFDISKMLQAAGYPTLSGVDLVDLQQALYRFLYSDEDTAIVEHAAPVQDEDQPLAARGHGQEGATHYTTSPSATAECGDDDTGGVSPYTDHVTCPRCLAVLAEQAVSIR